MIRSALAAFIVVCVCVGLMQIPPLTSAPPSSCPGGVCPVPMRVAFETLPLPQAVSVVPVSANHWTYPGEITTHMQNDHNISTAGLSREQALTLHDQLHESQTVRTSYQQVTHTAYAPVRYTTARRPIRSLASLPVRVMQRQPVRTALRRVFCR